MRETIDRLFREHAAVLRARLVMRFGAVELDLVESLVQDAFVRALEVWPTQGLPDTPLAWLTTVAKNAARDRLRRGARFEELQPQVVAWLGETTTAPADAALESEIADDLLRMMFVACHPALSAEARLALTLRTLCSLSTLDIARAFLTTEPTLEKRLVRARARIRELGLSVDLPGDDELRERHDSVLAVLYLLFSEGYHAHSGESVVRDELCWEAIRLARLLVSHPLTAAPRTSALLALFCFQAARLGARVDAGGALVQLADQDRSRWDRALITEGIRHLEAAGTGPAISAYHLEAAIAACHSLAPSFDQTRWDEVVRLYDRLQIVDDSPVIGLHRAIAIGYRDGPRAALDLLDHLAREAVFRDYGLLHAARGEMWSRLEEHDRASEAYTQAKALATTGDEARFLERRIEALRRPRPPR